MQMCRIGKEMGLKDISAVHRLDRLTSGVLILAKTTSARQKFSLDMKDHKVLKTYIAGVKGHFPADVYECSKPMTAMCKTIGI